MKNMSDISALAFSKMHGLGNDFMVIDTTKQPFTLDNTMIAKLGNRKTGVGFDQLLVVEPSTQADIDFNYRIFNTNGSEVEHCGNGARCFAHFVINHHLTAKTTLRVQIKKGVIGITYHDEDTIEVDMGKPILTPRDIPFQPNMDTVENDLEYELLINGKSYTVSVLSVGNPHAVMFVDNVWDMDTAEIAEIGQTIQQSDYFPESVNVNFAQIIDDNTIALRTYERGVGETDACGTGACATVFATHKRALLNGQIRIPTQHVIMRGGNLTIRLDYGSNCNNSGSNNEERIFMSGPAREVYSATVHYSVLQNM